VAFAVHASLVSVAGGAETHIQDVVSTLEPLSLKARSSKQRAPLVMPADAMDETNDVKTATSAIDDAWISKVITAT
jgi:hypothetical protein